MRGFLRVGRGLLCAGVAVAVLAEPGAAFGQKSGKGLQAELDGDGDRNGDNDNGKKGLGLQPQDVHQEGDYGGVVPGKVGDKPRKAPKTKRTVLTWIGFQKSGAGSRLFVQLTADADFEQAVVGNELVVTIPGARFGSRNASRRLDTRFFETSLREVLPKRARRQGKRKAGLALHISFKNPSDAQSASAKVSKEQDGFHYLYLDFGAGTTMPDTAQ